MPQLSLSWINIRAANSNLMGAMVLYQHQQGGQVAGSSQTVSNLPALAERHDLVTVPAAWPAGASQLAIAHDVIRRGNDVEVRSDWVASAR